MKWGRGEKETDRHPQTHKSKALSPWSPSKRRLLGAQERRALLRVLEWQCLVGTCVPACKGKASQALEVLQGLPCQSASKHGRPHPAARNRATRELPGCLSPWVFLRCPFSAQI